MNTIKVSLDKAAYKGKPDKKEIIQINNRIGQYVKEINITTTDMDKFILAVGRDGYTFCPATFKDRHRHQESFEQQQIIAMDFDNDNLIVD